VDVKLKMWKSEREYFFGKKEVQYYMSKICMGGLLRHSRKGGQS